MFIKARKARFCSCQSCGEQLVAVVNFLMDRDMRSGPLCRGRSRRARGACRRRPVAQLALRYTQSLLTSLRESRLLLLSSPTRAVMCRTSKQV